MFVQSRTERKITREGVREVCCQDKEEARGWALGAWRNTGQVCLTTPNRNWDLTPRLGEWVQGPSLIKTIHHYQSLLIYLFNPPSNVSVLIMRLGNTIKSPSQTFTVLRVLVCENLIVYCADRIRCFPGKRHSQEAKHFIWEHAQQTAHSVW